MKNVITAVSIAASLLFCPNANASVTVELDISTGHYHPSSFTSHFITFPWQTVLPGQTLDIGIDFLGHQAMKITDIGQEWDDIISFVRIGGVGDIRGRLDVFLSGAFFWGTPKQPNPYTSTCNPIFIPDEDFCQGGGSGDLTDTAIAFKDIHFLFTLDETVAEPALIRGVMFDIIGGRVNPMIPEPATFTMFGLGLAGIGVMRRRMIALTPPAQYPPR